MGYYSPENFITTAGKEARTAEAKRRGVLDKYPHIAKVLQVKSEQREEPQPVPDAPRVTTSHKEKVYRLRELQQELSTLPVSSADVRELLELVLYFEAIEKG
jgi:hypothetical protein